MRFRSKIAGSDGFTLVEIIVTIVMMGIMAAFFTQFMGTALDNSWKSVELVAGEAQAEANMEEIIAYYTSKINSDPDTALAAVKATNFGSNVNIDWIFFDISDGAGNVVIPGSGTTNTLKVTVEAPGNNLTTLLTRSRTASAEPVVNY